MVKPISPLQSARSTGQFGASGTSGVIMEDVTGFGLIQYAAWGSTLSRVDDEVARVAGCSGAPSPGQIAKGSHGLLMRVEPLKWWLVTLRGQELAQVALTPAEGVVLDMQSSRCWLRISGDNAEVLLNHFLPLNLQSSAFPVGTVASTGFHHVGVTLWRDEHGLNLLLPRSSARSLWELLSETARQYGLTER